MSVEKVPSLPANRQAVYNPGRLTDAEVKASFIARQALLELLLEDVESTRARGIPQHHLIVGQRGMGKTTLLRRLDVALREPSRSGRFIPLSFPEEQWSLDRLSKLWLNCLDSLADTLEREGAEQDVIDRIDDAVDVLAEQHSDEGLLAEAAERIFLNLAIEFDRRPVLLIDNLDLVFARLKKHEVNRLRAFLMRAGAPILIGACVSPPLETSDYGAAFYDHFKTHYLERLSAPDMRDVLLRLADRAGNKALVERLDAERPRLRALHALTGGNPRTTVILFQIFTKGFSQEAYQDLEALLDMMTPLYKARFEELPPQGQVVMSALATHWEPATSRQLAEITRLDNRQLSPQIDRLKKAGLIEEVIVDPDDRVGALPPGRSAKNRTGYQFAERFFNIWFLMRQATRRERRNLTFLTRFIECVHTPAERSAMARDLLGRRPLTREERVYGLALEPAVAEYGLRYELHDHVQQEMVDASRALQERIDELIDPAEIPFHRFAFADLKSQLKSAVSRHPDIDADVFADALLGSPALLSMREAIVKQIFTQRAATELMKVAGEDHRLVERIAGADAADWLANLLRRGTVVDLSDPKQVSDAFRRADTREKVLLCARFAERPAKQQLDPDSWETIQKLVRPSEGGTAAEWVTWAYVLSFEFYKHDEAEEAYRKALTIDPRDANAWNQLGELLEEKLNRYDEAETAYRTAIQLAPEAVWPKNNLGALLHYRLDRHAEAEAVYREALKLEPNSAWTWTSLGNLLSYRLNRFAEAEDAYRTALRLDPAYAFAWRNLAVSLHMNGSRYDEAAGAYRKSLEHEPKSPEAWRGLAYVLHFDLQRYEEAEAAYRTALELDPKDLDTWNNFALLLADCFGRGEEAVTALRQALVLKPNGIAERYNLISVLRDHADGREEAEALAAGLSATADRTVEAAFTLHQVLFSAYDNEIDAAARHLDRALDLIADIPGIPPDTFPAWMRMTAVMLHLGYGRPFLELLRKRGDHQRLRPWYEATRAILRGDRRYLRNTPVEVREVAGILYDAISIRLQGLPAATRRWSALVRKTVLHGAKPRKNDAHQKNAGSSVTREEPVPNA